MLKFQGKLAFFLRKKCKKSLTFFFCQRYTENNSGAKWSKNEQNITKVEGVTRIWSTLETSYHFIIGSKNIHNLALTFITPLQTENYINLFHSESLILPPKVGVFAWKSKPTAIFLHFLRRTALLCAPNAFVEVVEGSVSSFKKTCYLCGRFQTQ